MPAVPIKTPYGATVHRVFAIYGMECDPEKDAALFVIRDKTEKVWLWKTLKPEFNEELDAWTFVLDISHTEAEIMPKGSYKYGLTFYKDVVYDTDEADLLLGDEDESFADLMPSMPIDGTVVVPIARKAYTVQEAVAREEGLI